MCEFCHQHGEGKKWYLNVKNYSEELANELDRKKFLNSFYKEVIGEGNKTMGRLEKMFGKGKGRQLPKFIKEPMMKRQKPMHYGQVIPLEDVGEVLELATTVTKMPCGCRWAANKKEDWVCYGLTMGAHRWYNELDIDWFGRPDLTRFETLDLETACREMAELDKKGLIHSVWTFITPFIGGICNCDNSGGCLAMRSTYGLGFPSMFRAEYVAAIDKEKCSGCRKCEKICSVTGVAYNSADKKCEVDKARCYGCGVCRQSCSKNAIALMARTADPVAARYW
jgi:Pyruvate/2-oxoacid:ferredoxin oxidoreductase delta subunit